MKLQALSFFLLTLFTICIAKHVKLNYNVDETQTNVPKLTPPSAADGKDEVFNIDEACKASTVSDKCTSVLKSLGGDKKDVKPSKFSDKVVKHAQSEFGHASIKARKEMREDDAKIEVKKALSHCVKLYLDMNDELRGLYAVGLKSSNYGTTAEKFTHMAQFYPKHCEDELTKAGTSGEKLGLYENYKDIEELGNIVDVVTRYVSANSKQKAVGGGKKN
uniref:Pectinesterase inhibitor domain-containing protein n=1 Tax=Chenopodium quinoa TaxID=63459 RepID=A0A803L9Z9_CHEQI